MRRKRSQVGRILGPFRRTVQRYEVKRGTADDEPLLKHFAGQAGTREEQSRRTLERVRPCTEPKQVGAVFGDHDGGDGPRASSISAPSVGKVKIYQSRLPPAAYQVGMRRTS